MVFAHVAFERMRQAGLRDSPPAAHRACHQEKTMIGITRMSLCVAALAFAVSVVPPRQASAQHVTLEQAWAECLRQIRERGYTGPDYGTFRNRATKACIASFGHKP
jgi:hypothetical protein